MLVAAVIVDLAALLQFSGLISGLPAYILSAKRVDKVDLNYEGSVCIRSCARPIGQ